MSTILALVPISEEIKRARKEAKLTQSELAELCRKHDASIVQNDISDYENGKKNPSMKRLEAIAKALNKTWNLK